MQLNHAPNECAFYNPAKDGVCSRASMITKMREFLERLYPERAPVLAAAGPKTIVENVKEVVGCTSESCVLQTPEFTGFVGQQEAREVLKHDFKPENPGDYTVLLSNFNIDHVLDQVEKQKALNGQGFFHVPFQMRDFARMAHQGLSLISSTGSEDTNLATIDFAQKYKDGMRTFGCVINTDYSSGPGIHWFAIFGDFREEPFTIEYFNSSSNLPLIEISTWMKNLKVRLAHDLGKPVKDVIASRIEHQKDDFSCGVYALYYIISRLNGVPVEYFRDNRVPDELMWEFREHVFRKGC